MNPNQNKNIIIRKAFFTEDKEYRFSLSRFWNLQKPYILFIGLNPSRADENKDDPTIRRLMDFAKSFDCGGMYMTNLFPFVSHDPEMLYSYYPSGTTTGYREENLWVIDIVSKTCAKVVFCWGAFDILKVAPENMNRVVEAFPDAYCFGHTKDGFPKHPLYLKKDTQLINFQTKLP